MPVTAIPSMVAFLSIGFDSDGEFVGRRPSADGSLPYPSAYLTIDGLLRMYSAASFLPFGYSLTLLPRMAGLVYNTETSFRSRIEFILLIRYRCSPYARTISISALLRSLFKFRCRYFGGQFLHAHCAGHHRPPAAI